MVLSDFELVNFSGAILDGAELDGSNLNGAIFKGASLKGANFRSVLVGKNSGDSKKTYLPTRLINANMENADLTNAHLKETLCDKIRLKGGIFTGAKFEKCSMSDEIALLVSKQGATVIPK